MERVRLSHVKVISREEALKSGYDSYAYPKKKYQRSRKRVYYKKDGYTEYTIPSYRG